MNGTKSGICADPVANAEPLPAEPISYTLQNAAALIGLSVATLRRLERTGRLRFIRIRGRTLVCARSLRALASDE
jgi:excisionase family DNA binding protein